MAKPEIVASHHLFDGHLHYVEHDAHSTACRMRFSIFLPPDAAIQKTLPAVIFLSGLTCTAENFTTKAHAYRMAAQLGLVVIAPDTSPRGEAVADDEAYDVGQGAGFYVNATQAPWAQHYQMADYVHHELRDIASQYFQVDDKRVSIMGHSMGGHGALTLFLRHPSEYRSVSAFAPIVAPTQCDWGRKAFTAYLGSDESRWNVYDACYLAAHYKGSELAEILIDQGSADQFLESQLKPTLLMDACQQSGIKLRLRMQEGYDHSYFFIQTFMDEHLRHHARFLLA